MSNIIEFLYPQKTKKYLEDVFPIPALLNIPNWFKNLKHEKEFLTVKGCMPFLDSLTAGYILKMPQDFYIKHNFTNDEKEQDSTYRFSMHTMARALEELELNLNSLKPQIHSIKQVGDECPFNTKNKNLPFYKILNPFIIKTPPGYSCLFVPPLNNRDDRFEIISGIVDTDTFLGEINFPIILNGDKYPQLETTIERGTPYVQIIPFKRENWKMKIKENTTSKNERILQIFKKLINNYKTFLWRKKKWK